MQFLNVVVLPAYPPSVTYRAWADGDASPTILRRLLDRIARRFQGEPFIVACADEVDREHAERIGHDLEIFFAYCPGVSPLARLGGIAQTFPGFHLVCLQVEQVFSPVDLLDRLRAHHQGSDVDYSYIADLPAGLGAEIIGAALLAALANIDYLEGAPTIREAVLTFSQLREAAPGRRPVRLAPFEAGRHYSLPPLDEPPRITARDDAYRAIQALRRIPEACGFEAVENWNASVFEPDAPLIRKRDSSGPRIRVLYVSPSALYSGAEECLRGLVREVGRLGFEQAAVLGAEGTLSHRLREAGCEVFAANRNIREPGRNNEALAEQVFEAFCPDVVHCNSDPGPVFLEAAAGRGVPVIAHVRTTRPDLESPLFEASARIIAVSQFVKQRLLRGGVPEAKIHVVYDGVDPTTFRPGVFDRTAMRLHFGLPAHAFLVLMIATVSANKRHDLVVEGFALVLAQVPQAHLAFVGEWGDFDYLTEVKKQVRCAGIEHRVTWLPFQEDIRQVESAADVLVLCSDEEALGTCVLEAMSMEVPVVVSDSAGTQELVDDGSSGIVVPGGDAATLAAALHQLAGDEELRRSLGRGGRARVLGRFTHTLYAAQVAHAFQVCAGRHLLE